VGRILRSLPFFEKHTSASIPHGLIEIKPYQIILWVSLANMKELELPTGSFRFPAILDLGHSHNFPISEQQLIDWAGLRPDLLRPVGSVRVSGQRVPLVAANAWIHPNITRQRDALSGQQPFCLELDSGIAVFPEGMATVPRLPLLGLRALRRANLQLHVDCQNCVVSLRTPRRFRWFSE
jgi:hypothetical protein